MLSAFAAHLEVLTKEERASRLPALPAGRRANAVPVEGEGVGDTNGHSQAEDGRGASEAGGDRSPSKTDITAGPDSALDPILQVLSALGPRAPVASAPAMPQPAVLSDSPRSIEQLMAKLVRRVAWSGNGRRGMARLELGAGELAGATLTIQADDGVVRVALDLPPGVDRAAWKERISQRLGMRGLQVEAVDVA